MMFLAGYLFSLLMGLSLGMIGGGGSILTVPILVYLFQFDPMVASAYSLFIVGVTALVGGVQAYLQNQVDLKKGIIFSVPSFVGVYLTRAYGVPALPQEIIDIGAFTLTKPVLVMLVFSILMVLAAYSMIRGSTKDLQSHSREKEISYLFIGIEGLVVGGVTGFVGAGGGFLIIPVLVHFAGMNMKIAIGTSLMIIAAKSLIGFLGDIQSQLLMDWFFLFKISAIAVVGLFVGAKLKLNVSESILKKGFGWFVLIMGMIVLFDQLRFLSK